MEQLLSEDPEIFTDDMSAAQMDEIAQEYGYDSYDQMWDLEHSDVSYQ